ncbi:MAG: DivIVA domain-containing protein, partial [Ignavibacteria bacterium]|nr:DivIVA domain-containing protein [Ignavibacteria bacterium]
TMRGYDVSEVEAYLDTVGNTVENLFREIEMLKEQAAKLNEEKEELTSEINVYRENEKTFQKAIVKSQDMAEDILDNAKKRAELIIKEAEILSSKTKVQAQEEFLNLRQELEDLKNKNEAVIDDIKNYLAEKLNSIEEYQRNRKIFKLENNIAAMEHVKESEPHREEMPSNTFGLNLGSLNMGLDDQSSK